jgi:ABC-type uncharacterized transport system YnjBCD ATPase subunit/GNAT superfamily N-acetyltransferase
MMSCDPLIRAGEAPVLTIEVGAPIRRSFRVAQVAGLFDVPLADRSVERFRVALPWPEEAGPGMAGWQIGAIVGPSGSGKSTVARAAFAEALCGGFAWPAEAAVVDGFPAELGVQRITAALTAVGFSSPPAWVRPYATLSTGQRFRCDLARALLLDQELVAFDEFSSVVDRTVAQVGSACVARSVRTGRSRCRRFVAVTCHYDVLDWLEPDWVLDMASAADSPFSRGSTTRAPASAAAADSDLRVARATRGLLRRPPMPWTIRRCPRGLWPMFAQHHYMSGGLAPAARCYAASLQQPDFPERPMAFLATLPVMGLRAARRVHRLVVLPDYQGLGIGVHLLRAVAEIEMGAGDPVPAPSRPRKSRLVEPQAARRFSITTGHPGLIRTLAHDPCWRLGAVSKLGSPHRELSRRLGRLLLGSCNRSTVSFVYRGIEEASSHA